MSELALKAKLNDTERVLRALPEVWVDDFNKPYVLSMEKTGDSTGRQSRYAVAYVSTDGAVFCQYEESTLFQAENKVLGKLHGLK